MFVLSWAQRFVLFIWLTEMIVLVFRATEGLNKAVLGTLSLGFGEGLVGQVALREELLNTSEAKLIHTFNIF